MYKNILLKSFALLMLTSCAYKKVTINSKQEKASVYTYDSKLRDYKLMGETPYEITQDQINANISSEGVMSFKISKIGHSTESVTLVPVGESSVDVYTSLNEVTDWNNPESKNASLIIDTLGRSIQTINSYIKEKKNNKALTKVNQLILKYPNVALFYDIQGSIFLIQKKNDFAISSYKKSLELNPLNTITRKVLNTLVQAQ